MTAKTIIKSWCTEILKPNDNDVLVCIDPLNPTVHWIHLDSYFQQEDFFLIPSSTSLKKILKKQKIFSKEYGVESLGISSKLIQFNLNGKNHSLPLFIANVKLTYNGIKELFELSIISDFTINPFFANLLDLDDQLSDPNETTQLLNELGLDFQIIEGKYLANFNPHRFIILKELENILMNDDSNKIKEILGDDFSKEKCYTSFHEGNLFDTNQNQSEIIDYLSLENCVIQGPPGTGKSQVISNILGKSVANGLSSIVVSEKSVALDVIYAKLKNVNLDSFVLMHHHTNKSKSFVESLKSSWQLLELTPNKELSNVLKTDLLTQSLDRILHRLNQSDLIGGVDFSTFLTLSKDYSFEKEIYNKKVPLIPVWLKDLAKLNSIKDDSFSIFGPWLQIKGEINSDFVDELSIKIENLMVLLSSLNLSKYTLNDFNKKYRLSTSVHLFFHLEQPISQKILASRNQHHKAIKLIDGYLLLLEKEKLLIEEKKHWIKSDFSITQLLAYIDILKKNDRFSIKYWKTKKELKQFTNLNFNDVIAALDRFVELKEVQKDILDHKKLLQKLEINADGPSITQFRYLLNQLLNLDSNNFQLLLALSIEERYALKMNAFKFQEINHLITKYFEFEEDTFMFQELKKIQKNLSHIISNAPHLSISNESKAILKNTKSLKEANSIVYAAHWMKFKSLFPNLAALNGNLIREKIKEIIDSKNEEQTILSKFIRLSRAQKFHQFSLILQTPANKLTAEQKDLKKRLRIGKSILVKEFGKTRSHKAPRELISSEANLWIELLKPIVLCSPYALAKIFPLKSNIFDVAIFDEASQIPLPHALGCIYRSKKIAVAGDNQQMSPGFYFKKGVTKSSNLLSQVEYYWKNIFLSNHYRSEHSNLISFSNRYFYNEKLKAYPKFGASHPIELITVEGVYIERKNHLEAEKVVEILKKIDFSENTNVGVVAFNQTQLELILKLLPNEINERMNHANHYFKALEEVQGEECDHLIISLGYGFNEKNIFSKQFGPLNRNNGYRRLNVLMTRAKKKITFIRSVTSKEFEISDNEGVEMLRKLMIHLENIQINHSNNTTELNKGIVRGNNMNIKNPQHNFQSAQELINFYEVMTSRGWELTFEI